MKKKKPWVKGKNITISPKAHEALLRKVFIEKPKTNIRQVINLLLNLPIDL